MTRRLIFLMLVVSGAYLYLIFNLYVIQLQNGQHYLARSESQYIAAGLINAKRGTIYLSDKNGNKLAAAVNKDFPLIYAIPKAIDDASVAFKALAALLPDIAPAFEQKLSRKSNSYLLLERKADPSIASKVNSGNIKGIYVGSSPERFYPLGSLASQVLGFVGPNSSDSGESGQYGLERFYEDGLSGVPGKAQNGAIIQPRDGRDLNLTVDPSIQTEAENILGSLIRTSGASSGSFIVEEPDTGKILAMGGYPDFDPNNYAQSNIGDFLNKNVQGIYEPGSVMKVVTMAAGIDAGKITPETTYVDSGTVTVNGKKLSNYDLKNHGPYGLATMTNVIEHSINTGAIFAEKQTGNSIFKNYLLKFGFQQKTGIDLPGELSGSLKPILGKNPPQVNFSTASYGQGIAVTPIELISAVAAIANGGVMMRPYLNADLKPQAVAAVISPSTSRQVTRMMISAIDKAEVAKIDGYSLAGKTGTAYLPDFKNGGYTDNVIDTYVGFGPTSSPRFVALIKIDNLPSSQLAALTVVPAFRDLAQYILNYYNIPPDRLGQ